MGIGTSLADHAADRPMPFASWSTLIFTTMKWRGQDGRAVGSTVSAEVESPRDAAAYQRTDINGNPSPITEDPALILGARFFCVIAAMAGLMPFGFLEWARTRKPFIGWDPAPPRNGERQVLTYTANTEWKGTCPRCTHITVGENVINTTTTGVSTTRIFSYCITCGWEGLGMRAADDVDPR